MTVDELIEAHHSTIGHSLLSAHSSEGEYVAFNSEPFEKIGISAPSLIGCNWKEFCPASHVDDESAIVDQVFFTGCDQVVDPLYRFWPGRSVRVKGRISVVLSKAGHRLILREGIIIYQMSERKIADLKVEHDRAVQTAYLVYDILDNMLDIDRVDLPENLKDKIKRARDESAAIRDRYIRHLLS